MNTVKIHWLYNKGLEAISTLAISEDIESICIDKDPTAEAILRSVLHQLGLVPTEDLRIHLWKLQVAEYLHYFFIDDEQNNLIKQRFSTACAF
jgi:hypothetical protein